MISFMWRMWFSSMSWNFCENGESYGTVVRQIIPDHINGVSTDLRRGSWCQTHSYGHKNKRQHWETWLPHSALATSCVSVWSATITHLLSGGNCSVHDIHCSCSAVNQSSADPGLNYQRILPLGSVSGLLGLTEEE